MKETMVDLSLVLDCVEREPELPGSMHPKLRDFLLCDILVRRDLDALIEIMRITVRLTKNGILERIQEEVCNEREDTEINP